MRIGLICMVLSLAARAQSASSVAGAGQGAFPAGAVWQGVPLSALSFGASVGLGAAGAADGYFQTTLVGVGGARNILVNGTATSGSATVGGPASFSGTCALDMGDGTPPLTVPFAATLATDAAGNVTLALTLNGQRLPVAAIGSGNYGTQ
ncbi:MAG: hypothetical protein ABR567_01525 [Myxococcales bacterium]